MRSFDLKDRGSALITGAARGLGFALATELKRYGFGLVITGRDEEKVRSSAEKLGASYYVCDLSKEGAAKALYEKVKADGHEICVLVNNAGFGAAGELWKVPEEKDRDLIAVNIAAATELTKLFLSDACGRGYGALLNVCSIAAFQPGPYTASYYASKAYLHSYTLAAREEARKYGVSASALCPGPLDTEFFENAGANKPGMSMSAEKAAKYAVKRFLQGKKTIIPGFYMRVTRILPAALKTKFVAKMKIAKN